MDLLKAQLPKVYDPEVMTVDNSLEVQLNKYPEISSKVMDLNPQFNINYFLERTGRVSDSNAEAVTGLGENAYRWKTRGHIFRPAYASGTSKLDGSASVNGDLSTHNSTIDTPDTIFAIGVKHDPSNNDIATDFNPNDEIRFQSGSVAIVLDKAIIDDSNNIGILNCKLIGGTVTVDDLSADNVIGRIGTAFGEGSLGGYQNDTNEDWHINYTSIHRRSFNITGSAMKQVAWVVPGNGSPALWYFVKVDDEKKRHRRMQELKALYDKSSMSVSGHQFLGKNGTNQLTISGFNAQSGISAPITGDGLYSQIDGVNNATYDINTGMTDAFLTEYMARLAQRSIGGGGQGKEWLVLAGTKGRLALDKTFKQISGVTTANGGAMYDLSSGKDLSLGANFTTYHALGNKFTVMHYNVFDDPSIHSSSGGLTGTGDILFLDWGVQDGVANIEMFNRKGRGYIEKYIDGMHSLADGGFNKFAASGSDSAKCEMLSEFMLVLKNKLSCGILKATGDYSAVVTSQGNQTAKDWFQFG